VLPAWEKISDVGHSNVEYLVLDFLPNMYLKASQGTELFLKLNGKSFGALKKNIFKVSTQDKRHNNVISDSERSTQGESLMSAQSELESSTDITSSQTILKTGPSIGSDDGFDPNFITDLEENELIDTDSLTVPEDALFTQATTSKSTTRSSPSAKSTTRSTPSAKSTTKSTTTSKSTTRSTTTAKSTTKSTTTSKSTTRSTTTAKSTTKSSTSVRPTTTSKVPEDALFTKAKSVDELKIRTDTSEKIELTETPSVVKHTIEEDDKRLDDLDTVVDFKENELNIGTDSLTVPEDALFSQAKSVDELKIRTDTSEKIELTETPSVVKHTIEEDDKRLDDLDTVVDFKDLLVDGDDDDDDQILDSDSDTQDLPLETQFVETLEA
jgi:hypothetical protein